MIGKGLVDERQDLQQRTTDMHTKTNAHNADVKKDFKYFICNKIGPLLPILFCQRIFLTQNTLAIKHL